MEDPGITRLDIDHYQRKRKLTLSPAVRKETRALLAAAKARPRSEPSAMPARGHGR